MLDSEKIIELENKIIELNTHIENINKRDKRNPLVRLQLAVAQGQLVNLKKELDWIKPPAASANFHRLSDSWPHPIQIRSAPNSTGLSPSPGAAAVEALERSSPATDSPEKKTPEAGVGEDPKFKI